MNGWIPSEESRRVLSRTQVVALAVLGIAILTATFMWPRTVLTGAVGVFVVLYVATIAYYVAITMRGLLRHDSGMVSDRDPPSWPMYSILVPVYHEGAVIPQLLAALNRLDYPRERVEALILVEEDDDETGRSLALSQIPPFIRIVRVPAGRPRTKPRACNIGLKQCTGDLVVIYDAEDEPEPDQLKKAARAFTVLGPEVACLQARLGCYNARRNSLTGVYSTNYASWFGGMLPGLELSRAPIPLGGTSNHMRRDALERVGGWDPWNVTEDCELGIRLHQAGFLTLCLDSTTWEEATSGLRAYVRQRSRWVKGYLQTYFVHSRRGATPPSSVTTFADAFHLQMLLLVPLLTQLANPIFWLLTASWAFCGKDWLGGVLPPVLAIPAIVSFLLGNLLAVLVPMFACIRVGHPELAHYALLQPLHWILVSVSAWRGTLQLMGDPFGWDKTNHAGRLANDHDDANYEPECRATPVAPVLATPSSGAIASNVPRSPRLVTRLTPWPIVVTVAGCVAGITAGLVALFFVPTELRIRGGLADQWFLYATSLTAFMLASPFHAPVPDLLAALLVVFYRVPGFLAAAFATGGLIGIAQSLGCHLAHVSPRRALVLCLGPGLLLCAIAVGANAGAACLALHLVVIGWMCDRSPRWTVKACGTISWMIAAGCGPVGVLGLAARLAAQVCIVMRTKNETAHQRAMLVVLATIALAWASLWMGANAVTFPNPVFAFARTPWTMRTQTTEESVEGLGRIAESMRNDVLVASGSWYWAIPFPLRSSVKMRWDLDRQSVSPSENGLVTFVEPASGNPLRLYSRCPRDGSTLDFLFEKQGWRFYRLKQTDPRRALDLPRDRVN